MGYGQGETRWPCRHPALSARQERWEWERIAASSAGVSFPGARGQDRGVWHRRHARRAVSAAAPAKRRQSTGHLGLPAPVGYAAAQDNAPVTTKISTTSKNWTRVKVLTEMESLNDK